MQSKQETARTPLVRMRAAPSGCSTIYIMNVLKAKNVGREEESKRGELKEIMRTPRQVLKQQQEQEQ